MAYFPPEFLHRKKKNGKERTTIPFDISFPFVWITNKNIHKDLHNELSSHTNSMF